LFIEIQKNALGLHLAELKKVYWYPLGKPLAYFNSQYPKMNACGALYTIAQKEL
jgi:hypothetical protein